MIDQESSEPIKTTEQILKEASPEIRRILEELLRIERRYIHMERRPNGVFDELRAVIEREIKE